MDVNRGTIAILLAAASAAGAGATWVVTRDTGASASLEAAAPVMTSNEAPSAPAATPASGGQALASPAAVATPAPAARLVSRTPVPARGTVREEPPVAAPGVPSAPVTSAPAVEPVHAAPAEESDAPASVIAGEPSPREPDFEELLVPSGMVLGLQLDAPLSSEDARVEQRVEGRITRDVRVADRVAIPSGSRILGDVTIVERGGKLRDRARLEVRFTTIELADGTRVSIDTAPIVREGDGPGRESTAKIGGGAIGGAILGGILGGARGAVLGGTAGAAAGTGIVMAGGRNAAVFPAGTPLTVRLTSPASVVLDR